MNISLAAASRADDEREKALFAAASEDDAADPSSEKSGSVETDVKEQIKRLLDAEQA